MNKYRRNFLGQTGALTASALATSLGRFSIESANAQAPTDYKALVCVFLFGGNDSNNMVIPYDDYGSYGAVRVNVNIPQAQLLQISPPRAGATFGLHPNLAAIKPLFDSGKLAVICNSGPLLAPITKTDYQAGRFRPSNLFSHNDQQSAWQGLLDGTPVRSGWGGRMSDRIDAVNAGARVPTIVSAAGSALMTQGLSVGPFVIPQTGGVTLTGAGTDTLGRVRADGVRRLLAASSGNAIVDQAANVLNTALTTADAINPILTATTPAITTAFTGLNTGIANQLKQVARLIEAHSVLGAKRQFFFVSLGGFDNHSNQLFLQGNLLNQLAPALKAFYDATVALDISNSVTTYTMSDFSRTFVTNSTFGTDHAWGAHHLVLGGAVRGGDFYGRFPSLALRGTDDAGNNGAWIPTTAVDQIGSTLATWLGVSSADLGYIFPNLNRFATADLGFVS